MPSWDKSRKQWRAQVKWNGQRHRSDFATKREAADWESEKRKELRKESEKTTPTGMDLATLCNRYLDYGKLRFIPKTFAEKHSLCQRFLRKVGNVAVAEVTEAEVLGYLSEQAKTRSANVYNRDRKNLLAMWNWGMKILKIPKQSNSLY